MKLYSMHDIVISSILPICVVNSVVYYRSSGLARQSVDNIVREVDRKRT